MFKTIFEIGYIEYDEFLTQILEFAKDHPEQTGGMKLPPFSAKMIKMIPVAQKNQLLAQGIKEHKAEILPQVEMMVGRLLGPVRVHDFDITCDAKSVNPVVMMVEMSGVDNTHVIRDLLPTYYQHDDQAAARRMVGDSYTGSLDMVSVQNYMYMQPAAAQRLFIAKSITANKDNLMRRLESLAIRNGIRLNLNNIRMMVK